ncbi:MAG: sensor histidine kinase [Limisphaerales bacterium]
MESFSNSIGDEMWPDASVQSAASAARRVLASILHEFIEGLVRLRTRDLFANLLDLNAIEQCIGKQKRCDAGAALRQSLERHRTAAARRQVVFLSGISRGLWAEADAAVLTGIFDKVISNAVKYSSANSTIQAHALQENGCIVINVRDQGAGINEADQQKLFEKFTRLLDGSSAGRPGISKNLAGSVRWRSAPGSGSTFTLRLPVSRATAESAELADDALPGENVLELLQRRLRFGARN